MTATGEGSSANSGDIVVQGSQLKAGGDTTLDAARDLLLFSAANTQKTDGSNSSSGAAIGVSLGEVVLSELGNDGSAEGTTQAAVSEGSITLRDTDKQQQNVDDLSRDTDTANGSIVPILGLEAALKANPALKGDCRGCGR